MAAGAGLAAVAPLAIKGISKLAKGRLAGAAAKNAVKKPGAAAKDAVKKPGGAVSNVTSKLGDSIGKGVGDKVKDKIDESGGAGGIAKEAASGLLPGFGGGGSDGGGGGMEGVGKGRRMPVQQAIDVAVPIETAYNQWTQFEDWTEFMRQDRARLTGRANPKVNFPGQDLDAGASDFEAEINHAAARRAHQVAGSPQGITHTGVVTFHELAPAPDSHRDQHGRGAGRDDREGGPRHAPRQARRACGPAAGSRRSSRCRRWRRAPGAA